MKYEKRELEVVLRREGITGDDADIIRAFEAGERAADIAQRFGMSESEVALRGAAVARRIYTSTRTEAGQTVQTRMVHPHAVRTARR